MFLRKNWIPIVVFIIAIVGVGLYYLQTRPPQEPIRIIKATEVDQTPAARPDAEVPVANSQGGHFHADGTWHGEAHITPIPEQPRPSGHWSDAYLPHDIENVYADDPEALQIARAARVIRKYKDSLTPEEYSKHPEFLNAIQVKDNFYYAVAQERFSPERRLELQRLLFPVLETPPAELW